MMTSGNGTMVGYVCDSLRANPGLVRERYGGRSLLHVAAAAACLPVVELLLQLGAEPNGFDRGSHTPLYSVANESKIPGAGNVVRRLVDAGANVDASDGVKHCTALHMAARRGNVEVAEALLECGAGIEFKDSAGDTPLRRAVNCNQVDVARLLVSRGADVHSSGSRELTPLTAARSDPMKRLLKAAL